MLTTTTTINETQGGTPKSEGQGLSVEGGPVYGRRALISQKTSLVETHDG